MAIAKVYLWTSNAVMVFDETGQQLPAYQGMHPVVKDKILYDATDETEYYINDWQTPDKKRITKEEFAKGL